MFITHFIPRILNGVYIVYCESIHHSHFAGIFIPYVGGAIYIKNEDDTFSKIAKPQYIVISDTTSNTGAIEISSRSIPGPIIDAYLTGGKAGLVFRRDESYFTVKNNNDLSPMANTTVSIVVWYLPV